MKRRWTSGEIAALKSDYPCTKASIIADNMGRSIGSVQQKARILGVKKDDSFLRSVRFVAGHKSSSLPIGTEREWMDGYTYIKVADTGIKLQDWKTRHRINWEAVHGAVPLGKVVARKICGADRDEVENLECLGRDELMSQNTIMNYPTELIKVIHLSSKLKRKIKERQDNV